MIKQLLFTACAALLTGSVSAQDNSVTNPTADTWVGTGITNGNGSANTVEIRSYTSDSKTTNFYALLAFSFTKPNAGYTVKKATLRLTARYKKGDSEVKLYDFPAGFKETDVYSTLESSITSAIAGTAAADFKLNSYANWAPTDSKVTSDYSTVDKWQVNVDVTELVKSHANDGQVNMLLQKVLNQDNSSQIYSREATDVTNSTLGFTFAAADLYPQLTVEYEEETGVSTKTETSAKDTWIMKNSTSDRSAATTMEITTSNSKDKYLYGLMAFALPGSNYTITSAQLRLTTERIKGKNNMSVYAYGNDFAENTNYSNEESYVTAATSSTALKSFTVNSGVWNKALGTDAIASDVADISKWQTTVDLTDYANSLGSEYMNILLGKTDDQDLATKFFTKEQGDLTVKLSDGTTTTASASDLIPQLTLVYKKASYDLTVGDAGAATLVLPYEATIPSGVKAYTLSYTSGDEVSATEVSTTIPANTPVLINATAGTYTFEATDTKTTKAAAPAKDALTGVWTSTTAPSGSYILYNGTDGLGFYKADGSTNTVAANHAYLTATAATAKSLKINYNGTTNISNITNDENANAPVYNIQGMRMGKNLPKGIYIKNGKKFVVK